MCKAIFTAMAIAEQGMQANPKGVKRQNRLGDDKEDVDPKV